MGQKTLSDLAGVGIQHISNLENGRAGTTTDCLERLASALNCTVAQLLSENPLVEYKLRPARLIGQDVPRDLRRVSAILQALSELAECYPARLPLAAQAAQRLAARSRNARRRGTTSNRVR